jgi:type I restriction enzyme M protein
VLFRSPTSEIKDPKNDFNLNLPRYIDSSEDEDIQDLSAHIFGGIPNADIDSLSDYFTIMPLLRSTLFEPSPRDGYSLLKVAQENVLETIYSDKHYQEFIKNAETNFQSWLEEFSSKMMTLGIGSRPKLMIEELSEMLLVESSQLPLVDPYAIYQGLMSYSASVLQDDAFLIASHGWLEAAKLQLVTESDGVDAISGKSKFRSDLLPAKILIDAHLPELRDQLMAYESEGANLQAELDSIIEEYSGDEGLLNEVLSDKGKIVKKLLNKRIEEIAQDAEYSDEFGLLSQCFEIQERLDLSSLRIKEVKAELNNELLNAYKDLNEEKVKHLALIKWSSALTEYIEEDRLRVSRNLVERISTLGARYDEVLDILVGRVELLEKAIRLHLINMGVQAL